MSESVRTKIYPHITASEVVSIKDKLTLVDVRSPIEFETEHIAGSLNVPLDLLDSRIEEIASQNELVLICRSGMRAERGAHVLTGKGLKPKVLDGGILAWRNAGLPIVEGKKRLSIERQIQLIVGSGVLAGVLLGVFVNRWFLVVPGFFGAGLTFSGLSGTCTLGILLSKAPWNKLTPSLATQKQNGSSTCRL